MKLPLIHKYVYSENNYEMLLRSIKTIHEQSTERILDFISLTNDALVKQFGKRINQESAIVYYSSVLWEWFYLLTYYIHQLDNDPQWQENFIPHIKAFQIRRIAIEETQKGEALIDQFIAKRKRVSETQKQLQKSDTLKREENNTHSDVAAYISQITQLKAKIAELEEENISLKSRIAQLEEHNTNVHLSFIETNSKSPDSIRWAYEDIQKAVVGPAEMATCLHNLQIREMLKNQEPYGKLKKIIKLYEELQSVYGFEWKYDALRRALNRITNKKKTAN